MRLTVLAALALVMLGPAGCGERGHPDPSPPSPPSAGSGPFDEPARVRPGAAARGATAPTGQWFEGGEDGAPVASWGAPASEAVLRLYCDDAAGRLVLEREAHALPEDVRILTLEADGVRMDFPAERATAALGASLVTRIALDAPVLDRLLATPRVAVITGDESLEVGAPGRALRPVLEACRARH